MDFQLDLTRLKQELPNISAEVPEKYGSRLQTNYVPSLVESVELSSFSSALTAQSHTLSLEIVELERQLTVLKSRQAFLQYAAAPFQALTSAFRRFPPELLQYIFVWCLPSQRNAVMHASEAPVLLGRVCSEWRRVSLNTPALWSSLHIVPPNYHPDTPLPRIRNRFKRKRDLVKTWLARSGACPLSISFVWFGMDGDEETQLVGDMLELIVPLSKRWKRIELSMPLKMCATLQSVGREDVPSLEAFSLTDNRSSYSDLTPGSTSQPLLLPWPTQLEFIEGATSLTSLSLSFYAGTLRIPATLPWDKLTNLHLESNLAFFFNDTKQMLQTLERCMALRSCTLKLPLSLSPSFTPPPGSPTAHNQDERPTWDVEYPITLPELTSLCIDGDQNVVQGSFHINGVLCNLVAPNMKEISILGRSPSRVGPFASAEDGGEDDGDTASVSDAGLDLLSAEVDYGGALHPSGALNLAGSATTIDAPTTKPKFRSHEPLAGLVHLLEASNPPLESLKLDSIQLLPKPLFSCLRRVPSLTELVLRDYGASAIGVGGFNSSSFTASGNRMARKRVYGKMCIEDRICRGLTVDRGWVCQQGMEDEIQAQEEGAQEVDGDGNKILASPATSSWTMVEDNEESLSSPGSQSEMDLDDYVSQVAPLPAIRSGGRGSTVRRENGEWVSQEPLLPNLTHFELSVSSGSQEVLCRMVESRFLPDPVVAEGHREEMLRSLELGASASLLDGAGPVAVDHSGEILHHKEDFSCSEPLASISPLRSVKCTYGTVEERVDVQARFKRMQEMGLDVHVTCHPMPCFGQEEEREVWGWSSPWMGVEGIA